MNCSTSSRRWDSSSSITSLGKLDSAFTFLRHSRMHVSRSGMFRPPELVQGRGHQVPLLLLLLKGFSASGPQGVIFSFPTGFGFGPTAAHQTLVFQPMQNRVKHSV